MNSQEYIICPFCEKKFIKHFPTFRDHINEHDSEIVDMLSIMEVEKCYICENALYNDDINKCHKCDKIVCDDCFDAYNLCRFCFMEYIRRE